MIKEAFIHLAREKPKVLTFPTYYLPFEDKTLKEIGMVTAGLQELPEIPWPDDNCLIFAEDLFSESSLFSEGCPVRFIHAIVHEESMKTRTNLVPKGDGYEAIEPLEFYTVVYSRVTGQIRIMPTNVTMVRISTARNMTPQEAKEGFAKQLKKMEKLYTHSFTEEQKSALIEYWHSGLSRNPERHGCWMATSVSREVGEPSLQAGLANDILSYLANVAVPCHYVVRSRFEKGFGSTGKMKRMMRDKPIFSVISGSRIYREFVEPSGDMGPIRPHFRRGHIRHHWKMAGINRMMLPADPVMRIRLVHERKVPRSYIPPTWVGDEGKWLVDGVLHEVVTEEIPLRQL